MSTHLVFNGVGDDVKTRLEAYWAKKLPRLEKLLVPYPADLQEIRLTVSHHQQNSRHSFYEARAVIRLPTGTLAAATMSTRRLSWTASPIRSSPRSDDTRRSPVGITSSNARAAIGPISLQPGRDCKCTPRPATG